MSGYVDIHAHVLPGIDDGPSDLDGALELARAAVEAGTSTLAATPHLRSDFPAVRVAELGERVAAMREAIERVGIPVRLVAAAEVSLVWAIDATDEDLRLASYGQAGRDLLVEMPTAGALGLQQHLFRLRVRGYRLTLAHPERSPEFQRSPGRLDELAAQGILLQINADSLLVPDRRAGTRRLAETLCGDGTAHVIASDGHRARKWRPVTRLAQAVEAAAALVGPERAAWMAREAPAAIVDARALPTAPEIVRPRRRLKLFGRR